jgi:hypothetical protein
MPMWLNYKAMLPEIDEFDTLQSWWHAVRNYYNRWPVTSTKSTKELDAAIESFTTIVIEAGSKMILNRWDKLHLLYSSIEEWKKQHDKRDSKRTPQVEKLSRWVESEIAKSSHDFQPHVTDPRNISQVREHYFQRKNSSKLSLSSESQDYNLYAWWMNISKLPFCKIRSTETRALDKAIKHFSESMQFARTSALSELAQQIEQWKSQRGACSQRIQAIAQLEKYVHQELKKEEKTHQPPSIFMKFSCAVFSLPCFDFDYTVLFDSLSFLTSS